LLNAAQPEKIAVLRLTGFLCNIAAKCVGIEIAEGSAALCALLPFPEIAPGRRCRGSGSGIQPAARPLREIGFYRAGAVRSSRMDRREDPIACRSLS
jgi:hypothetical protein